MSARVIAPTLTAPADVDAALERAGSAVVLAAELPGMTGAIARWLPFWNDLPADPHLRDNGRYRSRRHGCFVVDTGTVCVVPHRAHWQSLDYNALHGGIERWFEPLAPALWTDDAFRHFLVWLAARATALRGNSRWYGEAHVFRIDTAQGIGRPTPEGAHRDGVDLVAVMLLGRQHVRGGETRVFEATGSSGTRFTLDVPGTTVLLDDARVVHETTPILPQADGTTGHRDTLVVTLRAGGFQAPALTDSNASR